MALENIRIVLVEPAHPGNIGAVARAMKTMSLIRLVLVGPRNFPSADADRRAMGANEILRAAEIFDDLDQAVANCRLVIGCSARSRTFPLTELDPRQAATRLVEETGNDEDVALVFGTERTGLSNRDIDRCTHQVLIPANEDFSSLNLAAAVQLLCYEVFMAAREEPIAGKEPAAAEDGPSTHKEFESFFSHLERALDSRGYLDGEMRDVTMIKFRRLIGRARPNAGELKLLHSLMRLVHREGG